MVETLKLGVAREVITPEIGGMLYGYPSCPHSEAVHDDLHVTVFAFSQKDLQALMISVELCTIRTDVADELRQELQARFDIPKENILMSCTHTHSGPAMGGTGGQWGGFDNTYYQNIFRPAFFAAVEQALQVMEPVTVGTAVGKSCVGVNRRELDLEDKVNLGINEWGPYNPNMTVISFRKENGGLMANMVAYGAHGTSAGASKLITRDWSGGMIDAMEAHTGAITAFFQGTEGDVAPRKLLGRVGCIEETEALGKLAADDAIRIFETISDYQPVSIAVREDMLRLPTNPRMPYDEVCRVVAAAGPEENMKLMQREEHLFNLKVKKSYEEGYQECEYEAVNQIVFRIGDVIFAGAGFELFCEIGMRIDKAFSDRNVICLSCTNGKGGYFPTRSQLYLGGYEIISFRCRNVQRLVDNADFYYVKETIRNINAMQDAEK